MTTVAKRGSGRSDYVRRLAAETLLTERTVYRWFSDPTKAHFGNRFRLEAAAVKLGIPLPAGAAA